MTFFEQWGEPAAGLALGREGLEIGRRLGSRWYGSQMVGNSSICAFRVGEWDFAAALIDEWLAADAANAAAAELYVDRAILHALRGEDAMPDIEEGEGLLLGASGHRPPVAVVRAPGSRLVRRCSRPPRGRGARAGRPPSSHELLRSATYPLVIRSTLRSGIASARRRCSYAMEASGYGGPGADRGRTVGARAGIDALEGRGATAIAGYRERSGLPPARARLRGGGGRPWTWRPSLRRRRSGTPDVDREPSPPPGDPRTPASAPLLERVETARRRCAAR